MFRWKLLLKWCVFCETVMARIHMSGLWWCSLSSVPYCTLSTLDSCLELSSTLMMHLLRIRQILHHLDSDQSICHRPPVSIWYDAQVTDPNDRCWPDVYWDRVVQWQCCSSIHKLGEQRVLTSESWCKENSAPFVRISVVNEVRLRLILID